GRAPRRQPARRPSSRRPTPRRPGTRGGARGRPTPRASARRPWSAVPRFAILRRVPRGDARGLTLLDLLIALALLALLVWLVRRDWRSAEPPAHGAMHSSWTSVCWSSSASVARLYSRS